MRNQFALKRAIFPDGKLLQPIPTEYGVHPNISGNINSTTSLPQPISQGETTINNISNSTSQDIINEKGWAFYILFFSIALLIISIFIFIYKKIKQKYRIRIEL